MRQTAVIAVLLLACTAAGSPSFAFTIDTHDILYADENGSGYRELTAIEPSADEDLPVSTVTVYPETDTKNAFDIVYRARDIPGVEEKDAALIVRTNFLLQP
jgi:hypothetical protein